MTLYPKGVDLTEPGIGIKYSCIVGSGGVTAGHAVVRTNATNTVILAASNAGTVLGLSRDTVAQGGVVTVLGPGCLVRVPYTLTVGGKVGCASSGDLTDFSANTVVGTTDESATAASIVRVQISGI